MDASATAPYKPGLEGVLAGESAICSVDADAGLLYRGYDIHDLATRTQFEQVAWLILRGDLPSPSELASFKKEISSQRAIPDAVVAMLKLFPNSAHPMDLLRTGVSMLGSFDPDLNDHSHDANMRKSIRLLARMPTLTAAGHRIKNGHEHIAPRADLSNSANFLYTLTGKEPEAWRVQAMDVLFALYAEHEFNASTFAARVTASTMADMYAAITTAIGTL
ncbi:MAG: citrate/2-methylcitrate synthase, partial [Tepidisphaeraceae bacterium]